MGVLFHKCKRYKDGDVVLYENVEWKRKLLIEHIEREKKLEERKENILKCSEKELFYIQNGYVGNDILWWGLGSCGYTADITKAQKYTREEILNYLDRKEDKIWLASHVEKNIKQHIDAQYLDSKYKI